METKRAAVTTATTTRITATITRRITGTVAYKTIYSSNQQRVLRYFSKLSSSHMIEI